MHNQSETKTDTHANRIDPVLREADWGVVEGSQIHRELICPGRITPGGRMNPLSADYVLVYRERKLAVIEAKRAGLGYTEGVGQAKDYAERLHARFAYATNGRKWYGIDMQSGREGDIALPFPAPQDLWDRCFPQGNDWRERFGAIGFEVDAGKWQARYYQHNAITRALDAIAERRTAFIQHLAEMGYDDERLKDMRHLIDAPDSDIFDVLAYVRFTLAPLSRAARANGLGGYEREMRSFLDYVLDNYRRDGIGELAPTRLTDFLRIRYGGTNDAKRTLGSVSEIRAALFGVQAHLFAEEQP